MRDYTLASYLPEDLKKAHKQVVDAFCRLRPSKVYGWTYLDSSDLAEYINNEISHHVRSCFEPDSWLSDSSFIGWVDSQPADTIADAAWDCLSMNDLIQLVVEAEKSGDALKTAVRLNAQAGRLKRLRRADEREQMQSLIPRMAAAFDSLFDPAPPPEKFKLRERAGLRLLGKIFGHRDMGLITTYYAPRIKSLTRSDVVYEDALNGECCIPLLL
eukprot:SAG31_NODE_1150_length_9648_cov_37.362656_5_plen_215_part_00